MSLYRVLRPLLFALDPERVHSLGLRALRFLPSAQEDWPSSLGVKTSFGDLANRIGLAAGYDKTGKYVGQLAKLGFGYIVAGTVTLAPRAGLPRPRLVRNRNGTLVNALGFPNPGLDQFMSNLSRQKLHVPLVVSISGETISELVQCYSRSQPPAAGIEINLSSPNTPGLRDLREPETFGQLTEDLRKRKTKPTFLKLPPYLDESEYGDILDLVKVWRDAGFEGVTASNTIPVSEPRVAVGAGGLSGPPLFEHTLKAVGAIRRLTGDDFEIHAVGGITTPADVNKAVETGATTVQLFTALVFRGPSLVREILGALTA